MDTRELNRTIQELTKAVDTLSGQCFAYEVLFATLPKEVLNYVSAKQIVKALHAPIGSNAKSVASRTIDRIEKELHKE